MKSMRRFCSEATVCSLGLLVQLSQTLDPPQTTEVYSLARDMKSPHDCFFNVFDILRDLLHGASRWCHNQAHRVRRRLQRMQQTMSPHAEKSRSNFDSSMQCMYHMPYTVTDM